jgi:hypothetical protein
MKSEAGLASKKCVIHEQVNLQFSYELNMLFFSVLNGKFLTLIKVACLQNMRSYE